jgi:hypothetical protein
MVNRDPISFLDKYAIGKRDHSFNREWTFQKFWFGYGISYLLLRELPIRNFYARAWIMFFFLSKVMHTSGWLIGNGVTRAPDDWSFKEYKNYQAWKDWNIHSIPTHENRLPEERVWQLAQPAFMKRTHNSSIESGHTVLFPPKTTNVTWDGTWNMPLEALAHPKHKDSKWIDFMYQ